MTWLRLFSLSAACLLLAGCGSPTTLVLKTPTVPVTKASSEHNYRVFLVAQKQRGEPQVVDEFRSALAATGTFTVVDTITAERESSAGVFTRAREENIDYILRIDVKQFASATTGADRKLAASYFKAWGITYWIGSAILASTKWIGLAAVKADVNVWFRQTGTTVWEKERESYVVEQGKENVDPKVIKQAVSSLATTNLARETVNQWLKDSFPSTTKPD